MTFFKMICKTIYYMLLRRCGVGSMIRYSDLSKKSYISRKTRFYSSTIGSYSYTGSNCYFYKTNIGKYTSISDNCSVGMPEHDLTKASTSPVFSKGKNRMKVNFASFPRPKHKVTEIGNDVWIGMGVYIKAGVKIGDGAVIGMGSIVTKDVEPYTIVAGNPAKIIRYRYEEEIIKELLAIQWWNIEVQEIKKNVDTFKSVDELIATFKHMGE